MSAKTRAAMRVRPGRNSAAEWQEPGSEGFALILALLALLLLTFLGLTLATTTSTELQIASNYRWSLQAAYNAEAGIEVAKVTLRNTSSWGTVLPVARALPWPPAPSTPAFPAGLPMTDGAGNPLRHLENAICDARGGGVGYGLVLNDATLGLPLQYISSPFGAAGGQLNGAFTVWVRRDTTLNAATGQTQDNTGENTLVLTSEGIAPFLSGVSANAGTAAYAQANMAVAIRELAIGRAGGDCSSDSAQAGAGISGSGFDPCARLRDLGCGIDSSFGNQARQMGAPSSVFGSGLAGLCADTQVQ